MEYLENGKLEIIENIEERDKEKAILSIGTIVYCKGSCGAGSFYGIVYPNGVLELENGSDEYINTQEHLHLGDCINFWTIEKVVKAKLIIKEIIEEV